MTSYHNLWRRFRSAPPMNPRFKRSRTFQNVLEGSRKATLRSFSDCSERGPRTVRNLGRCRPRSYKSICTAICTGGRIIRFLGKYGNSWCYTTVLNYYYIFPANISYIHKKLSFWIENEFVISSLLLLLAPVGSRFWPYFQENYYMYF